MTQNNAHTNETMSLKVAGSNCQLAPFLSKWAHFGNVNKSNEEMSTLHPSDSNAS